ncbi:MAG: penicillin acylase family protein, partial [Alphaproteobacteria bacterium]|nr:penicillin acylase family protein [Alphaproteobacteria bacterium]
VECFMSRSFRTRRRSSSRLGRSSSSFSVFRIVAIVVAILVLSGGGFWYYWSHRGLPKLEGKISVTSLNQRVSIVRDENGVPKITAASDLDGYRALGFVHAQDRYFQMDLMRRLASGRLAEWFGRDLIESDQFFRSLQLRRIAEANYAALSPEVQAAMTAYSQGVNAVIEARNFSKPPEYLLIPGGKVEEWTPVDSLLWGKLTGVFLGGNMRSEICRARLITALPENFYKELFPDSPTHDYVTMAELDRSPQQQSKIVAGLNRALAAIPAAVARGGASNQWILAPSRTDTGAPILANDPHLALAYPGSWYLMEMETPSLHLKGATAPGVPFLILGRNENIAWSLTTTQADVQDLFVEKLSPNHPGYYETPDGEKPLKVHEEVIKINSAADQVFTVRETRHGPVISNLVPGTQSLVNSGTVMALQSTILDNNDRSFEAFFKLSTASNWEEFRAALTVFGGPPHNFGYADRAGHIGMVTAGVLPIRRSGDGTLPTAGWTGQTDWIGSVPPDKWPMSFDPPSGVIINANNRVIGDDYPYFVGTGWLEDYRARRIAEKIASKPRHSLADTAALQNDVESLAAREILPRLLAAAPADRKPSEEAEFAKRLLQSWNYRMEADKPEPLIFAAWMRHLKERLFAPLKEPRNPWRVPMSRIARMIANDSVWCSGEPIAAIAATPVSCDGQIADALDEALAELSHDFGSDPLRWKWGEAHRVQFAHPIFDYIPVLRNRFELSIPAAGGNDTVMLLNYPLNEPARPQPNHPYFSNYGSEYRAIYDLSQTLGIRMVAAPGQSGQPWSAFADSLLSHWSWGNLIDYSADSEGNRQSKSFKLELVP